jgi:ubiquitin carboxyl-terminal hydrolase L5
MVLGAYQEDWMDVARPLITERMQQYEGEQIQFNLLSLCRSPLLTLRLDLAYNIHSLNAVESALDFIKPEWKEYCTEEDGRALRGINPMYGITNEILDSVQSPSRKRDSTTAEMLLGERQQLMADQGPIRAAILEEEAAVNEDNERARGRRHDYTPMINKWTRLLAENGTLQELSTSHDIT